MEQTFELRVSDHFPNFFEILAPQTVLHPTIH